MKLKELTGKKFGYWEVIEYAGDRKWKCKCTFPGCTTVKDVATGSLTGGRSTCCEKHKSSKIELAGQQFGQLKVISYAGKSAWNCECSCGNSVIRLSKNLRSGSSTMCDECLDKKIKYDNILNKVFGDYKAIEYLGSSRWNMQCLKCGSTKKLTITEIRNCERLRCDCDSQGYKYEGQQYGDMIVVKRIDKDNYLCRCRCGYEKTLSDSAVYNYRTSNNYICKHKDIIGKRFGKLIVNKRLKDGMCECTCDCGNTTTVYIGNLLDNSTQSCGCLRSEYKYTRDEVIDKINEYIKENKELPCPKDLTRILDISMTTVYGYIDNYNLEQYIQRIASVAERDILKLFNGAIQHDRKVLNGQELDIYIPDKKLAIEYNGSYWHCNSKKDKYYHQQKTIACAKQGIRLVHIFEYEWENKETHDRMLNFLKKLSNNNVVINAKDLSICEISNEEAYAFENKNSLYGKTGSDINIALKNDNDIIGLMAFKETESIGKYEIASVCYKDSVTINGGLNKMFNYFINKYKHTTVTVEIDISKFTGNSYLELGFKNVVIEEPDYVWVDSHNKVLDKSRLHEIVELDFDTNGQTEEEILSNLGYIKVYDCGKIKLER